jgi:hypothetical protein
MTNTNRTEMTAALTIEMNRSRIRCGVCAIRCQGSSGYCRTHKFAVRRAAARIAKEGLILDFVGRAWWIWDAKGDVLVIGQNSKGKALAMLDLGVLDHEEDSEA